MALYSVIKNEGPGGILFWKHEKEDFRTGSQLVVSENEDALFDRDGVILEVFTGGKYSLLTVNYPFLDTLCAKFSGGKGAFSCKVYFVNKSDAMEQKWGTDSPIQVRDQIWGIATQVVSRGSYTVRVANSKKFVLKFVGNNFQVVSTEAIRLQFRSIVIQKIKTVIASAILSGKEKILGLASKLDDLSAKVSEALTQVFDEYGIELVNFYVRAVDIPEDALGRIKLEEAMAQRAQLNVLGADWQRVQSRDIMMVAADNNGTPGIGAGVGVGLAALGGLGNHAAQTVTPAALAQPPKGGETGGGCSACHCQLEKGVKFCPNCGAKVPQQKFCPNCGKPAVQGSKFCQECGTRLENT